MKKQMRVTAVLMVLVSLSLVSCKKEECHECHYDGPNGEVELGEKCGTELEELEASGYNEGGTNYEVHCHGH